MIYCPKCGTANRKGSRFCNECGAPLSETGVRCPECSEMNPTGNIVCDYCGARLTPSETRERFGLQDETKESSPKAPIKGLSLPTIPLEDTSPGTDPSSPQDQPFADLPEWLRESMPVDEEEKEELEQPTFGTSPPPFEEEEDIPIPDWLSGPQEEEEEEPLAPAIDETIPSMEVPSMEAPSLEETGIPDWLRELEGTDSLDLSSQMPEREEDEVPDWLESMEGEEEAAPPPSPSQEEGQAPDWIQDLQATASGFEAESPAQDSTSEEGDVPDWLRDMELEDESAPSFEEQISFQESEEQEADIPDWLREVEEEERPTSPAQKQPEPEVASEEPVDIPDWLQELEAPAATEKGPSRAEDAEQPLEPEEAEEASPFPKATPEPGAVPDWLEEFRPPEEELTPPEEPGIPDWLLAAQAGAETETPPEPQVEPSPPPMSLEEEQEEQEPLEPGEIPDWLLEMRPDAVQQAPSPAPRGPTPGLESGLAPAEIPEWLEALRPGQEAEAAQEPMETEGLLEGLRGTLPASPLVEKLGKVEAASSVVTSDATIARAELLQELVNRPETVTQRKEKEQKRATGWAVQRFLISLVLLLAILAPTIADIAGFDLLIIDTPLPAEALTDEASRVYATIETRVQPGVPVLVAFDYTAAEADEADQVAESLLLHLVEQEAQLILISSEPQGPALADRLFADMIDRGVLQQEQAERIVNLGYVPGQAMGIQSALLNLTGRAEYWSGVSPEELATLANVSSAEDIPLLVVLAGQASNLQAWIEQSSTLASRPAIVAGISARAWPISRPYLAAEEQLEGVVTGLFEASAYRTRLGLEEDAQLSRSLQSLTLAHLTVAGLMLIGAVFFMVGGKGR